jgi:hypothetical protein
MNLIINQTISATSEIIDGTHPVKGLVDGSYGAWYS